MLFLDSIRDGTHFYKKNNYTERNSHIYSHSITLAYGICPPPPKLKQGGQKYIFQFSRCESFHLVIQMSLVFCVNRCPYPTSFISISWLGFSMQLAVLLPHRYEHTNLPLHSCAVAKNEGRRGGKRQRGRENVKAREQLKELKKEMERGEMVGGQDR